MTDMECLRVGCLNQRLGYWGIHSDEHIGSGWHGREGHEILCKQVFHVHVHVFVGALLGNHMEYPDTPCLSPTH